MKKFAMIFFFLSLSVSVSAGNFQPDWIGQYGWAYEAAKHNYITFKGVGKSFSKAMEMAKSEMNKLSANGEIINQADNYDGKLFTVFILARFEKTKENRKSKFSEIKKTASEKISCGFRSMIIPGFGQYHNKRYSKAVLFFTATLAGGYMVYDSNKKADELIDDKEKLFVKYNASSDLNERNSLRLQMNTLVEEIDSKQKQRDMFMIGTGVVYALNVIDALVFSKKMNHLNLSEIRINDNTNIQISSRNIRLNIEF